MNKTLTSLMSLVLLSAPASAYTVGAPIAGTVSATTYSSSGVFHGAVDITSDTPCGYWGVETGFSASLSWTVTIRNPERVCTGSNQNEAKHVFANGYTFRLRNFLATAASVSKTCSRCQIGDENNPSTSTSHPLHLQYDKGGTLNTAWYSGTTQGEYLDHNEVIGNVG